MNKCFGASLRRVLAASLLVLAVALNSPPVSAEPLAIGAIDSVDRRTETISILGQRIRIDSAQLVAGNRILPAGKGVSLLAPDAIVRVDGVISRGKARAEFIYVLPERNVPGGTLLFVAGVLSEPDAAGFAKIGELRVDLVSFGLHDLVEAGSYVEIVGIQPVAQGDLVAQGIVGSGKQGIVGSGLHGIVGSGKQGIVGSGLDGIVGSGTQGIVGSGLHGIVGSGTQGIVGSGLQGIVGSGIK